MMTQFAYMISVFSDGTETIYKTNDVYGALRFLHDRWNDGFRNLDLVDGYTGEVLIHFADGDEDVYMSPEARLMWMGFVVTEWD